MPYLSGGGLQIDKEIFYHGHPVLIRIISNIDAGYRDINQMERALILAYDCIAPRRI